MNYDSSDSSGELLESFACFSDFSLRFYFRCFTGCLLVAFPGLGLGFGELSAFLILVDLVNEITD